MTRLRSFGLFVSAAAATALLSAPIAFADDGHGDRHRGRDGDEHAVVVVQNTPAPTVTQDRDNDDVNEDVNEDADEELQAAPDQPQLMVDVEQEVNDLNDDND